MKPETEIRNLKRELNETRRALKRESGQVLIIGKLLLDHEKELIEWKKRFDMLLSRMPREEKL